MKRGIISLTNLELKVLYDLVVFQNQTLGGENGKESLLVKLAPAGDQIESTQNHDVLISGDEAELILDSMSAPNDSDDQNLVGARLKIQQFLSKSRLS